MLITRFGMAKNKTYQFNYTRVHKSSKLFTKSCLQHLPVTFFKIIEINQLRESKGHKRKNDKRR